MGWSNCLSHLGVFDREVHHRVRGAQRVGRVGDQHVVDEALDVICRRRSEPLRGHTVEHDIEQLASLIDVRPLRHRNAGRRRVDGIQPGTGTVLGEHKHHVGRGGVRQRRDVAAQDRVLDNRTRGH